MMRTPHAAVYVVDDDVSVRESIVGLAEAAGYSARGFASAAEFLRYSRPTSSGCLVLDVEMPELSGLDLQRKLKAGNDALPIIFVSGHGDVPMSVTAIKAGAIDFLTKPLDTESLLDAIERAVPRRECTAGLATAQGGTSVGPIIAGIVGDSRPLRALLEQVKTVAKTDTTVLIQGETGTGKERIARALHDFSDRAGGPFIKVNCAAIPAALLESELMGHERGAFTGAVAQRIGRFELAHGGTLFLDEIGELPLELQPKLLRVLQEREFERLGSVRTQHSNARVIAATNRDLKAMATSHTFREDLYYRLSVFPVFVPPLRERRTDIPLLARHFVGEFAARMGRDVTGPSVRSLERLTNHDWPGNIRELQNVLERAVVLANSGCIEVPEFGVDADPCAVDTGREMATPQNSRNSKTPSDSQGLADVSKAHILRVLTETNWVIAGPRGAAARLEMKRTTLNFRMKKLGIVRGNQDST